MSDWGTPRRADEIVIANWPIRCLDPYKTRWWWQGRFLTLEENFATEIMLPQMHSIKTFSPADAATAEEMAAIDFICASLRDGGQVMDRSGLLYEHEKIKTIDGLSMLVYAIVVLEAERAAVPMEANRFSWDRKSSESDLLEVTGEELDRLEKKIEDKRKFVYLLSQVKNQYGYNSISMIPTSYLL